MAKDLTVILQDHPGTLADMGEILGKAGINIEGICGTKFQNGASIHILVEDAAAAREALEARGLRVSAEREVLVKEIEDRPGAMGEIARKLADAGVNLEVIYLTTKSRLVIGVNDIEKARTVI